MTHFAPTPTLASAVVRRLADHMREGDSPMAFAIGGGALANALVTRHADEPLSEAIEDLADAMVGCLLAVRTGSMSSDNTVFRVRLSVAAAALAVARPHAAPACRDAIGLWLGWGLGPARWMEDADALAARVILHLYLDDPEAAAQAVDALGSMGRGQFPGILYDWVVARLQGHGVDRELACFRHLRIAVAADNAPDGAGLAVVGGLLHARRAGVEGSRVADFLAAFNGDAPPRTPEHHPPATEVDTPISR